MRKGRLRKCEVVGVAVIKELVTVLDLEDEMLEKTLSHLDLTVNKKSEGDEVGIPLVQLCGTISD